MYKKNIVIPISLLIILFVVSHACGSSNEGTVITPPAQEDQQTEVEEAEQADAQEPEQPEEVEQEEEASTAFDVFEVGDLIEVKDHTARLNSIAYLGNVLVANFTFENHGDSDITVSSLLSFSSNSRTSRSSQLINA